MRFGTRGKKEIKNNLIQFEGEVKEKIDVLSIPIEHSKKGLFYSGSHELLLSADLSFLHYQHHHFGSDCVTVLVLGKGRKIPPEFLVHY